MSKKLSTILLIVCLFLMTGCGKEKKTLTCKQSFEETSSTSEQEYELQFDQNGKVLNSYVYKEIKTYEENISEEKLEEAYELRKSVCGNYEGMKGVKCNLSKEDRKMTTTLEISITDLDESGKNVLGLKEDQDSSYDDFKKTLGESGFSCK